MGVVCRANAPNTGERRLVPATFCPSHRSVPMIPTRILSFCPRDNLPLPATRPFHTHSRAAILSHGQIDLTRLFRFHTHSGLPLCPCDILTGLAHRRYNTHSGFATLLGIPAFLPVVFGRAGLLFRE
jgi:hypothetical protein